MVAITVGEGPGKREAEYLKEVNTGTADTGTTFQLLGCIIARPLPSGRKYMAGRCIQTPVEWSCLQR